jgi:hypothetical protein
VSSSSESPPAASTPEENEAKKAEMDVDSDSEDEIMKQTRLMQEQRRLEKLK